MDVELVEQCLSPVIILSVQVQMQHGVMFLFLRLQAVDGETLEQFAVTAEVMLHGGDKKALAEPSRTAQEIIGVFIYKPMYIFCLVNIQKSVSPDFTEILVPYRIFYILSHNR